METELKLQKHGNFSKAEKEVIIKALDTCKDMYEAGYACGLCGLILNYLKENTINYKELYTKLSQLYYNQKFYIANGLYAFENVDRRAFTYYWWPIRDVESRLKAIELLRKAIIND